MQRGEEVLLDSSEKGQGDDAPDASTIEAKDTHACRRGNEAKAGTLVWRSAEHAFADAVAVLLRVGGRPEDLDADVAKRMPATEHLLRHPHQTAEARLVALQTGELAVQLLQSLHMHGGGAARPRSCIELIEDRLEVLSDRGQELDLYGSVDGVVAYDGLARAMVQLREDGCGREH